MPAFPLPLGSRPVSVWPDPAPLPESEEISFQFLLNTDTPGLPDPMPLFLPEPSFLPVPLLTLFQDHPALLPHLISVPDFPPVCQERGPTPPLSTLLV